MSRNDSTRVAGVCAMALSLVAMAWTGVSSPAFAAEAPASHTLLFEAEAVSPLLMGDWLINYGYAQSSGDGMLWTTSPRPSEAMIVIDLPAAGVYHLWTRARDFTRHEPGSRRYQLLVDGQAAEKEAGDHGHDGWYWQHVGTMTLEAGRHLLSVRNVTAFARCDAILLTTSTLDPNSRPLKELAAYRKAPVEVGGRLLQEFPAMPPLRLEGLTEAARLENEHLRLIFMQGEDEQGQPRIVTRAEVFDGGQWSSVTRNNDEQVLFSLFSPTQNVSADTYFPSWESEHNSVVLRLEINGQTREVKNKESANPFLAGQASLWVPRSYARSGDEAVEVTYQDESGHKAIGRWELRPDRRDAVFTISFEAPQAGYYSVGFSGLRSWSADDVEQVLLPPTYQFQRLPDRPRMVTSAITTHPMVLVQTRSQDRSRPITVGLVADPSHLPFEWPTSDRAAYGFSPLNVASRVQPTIFNPVLGMTGSKHQAGEKVTACWRVLAMAGDWIDAQAYTSRHVFEVKDDRQPVDGSLTDAAVNMIKLIRNADASGWDDRLKGFYNIEAPSTVTHASPLTLVSAAVLSEDEQLYVSRSLPTIEYLLSRPQFHFALDLPKEETRDWITERTIRLHVPNESYGTSVWQGLHDLLSRANPWIAELAMDNGEIRINSSYMPKWSEMLAAYRLTPSEELLRQIQHEADAFIKKEFESPHRKPLGLMPFYHYGFYPYWWDLVDLYELTGQERYLDAARQGAYHTMAGQWAFPQHGQREQVIHPNGSFEASELMWYKGSQKYRLGWPRRPGDTPQKTVPAWEVSPVGLGFEQPSTFFRSGGAMHLILMSAWAPNLLRAAYQTGDDLPRVFARNSIIGRFANYPGYYINGFTDLVQSARYPYEGPDVTYIYYHHIPVQLAFTLDWLVTEAEVRSQGRIRFPWVKQQGYVWFINRIYGHGMGRVFDDQTARVRLLKPDALTVREKAINHLHARGDELLWVILMNETTEPVTATVQIDPQWTGVRLGQPYRALDAEGRQIGGGQTVQTIHQEVPGMGLVALALPAEAQHFAAPPAVEGGHVQQPIAEPWGQMHAFRIRGPFGKDSLYVVLTGRPENGRATLRLAEDPEGSRVDSDYPYEFTVYPWPMDKDMSFTLTLEDGPGRSMTTDRQTLQGTSSSAD